MLYDITCCSLTVHELTHTKGFGDRMDFYATAAERADGTPARPDTSVMDVCLTGVVYSAYLALHFFRKNANKAGKLVSTSSMCGLYPGEGIPLYTAAKHGTFPQDDKPQSTNKLRGVVGLTLAMSKKLAQLGEPITVNCTCPGMCSKASFSRYADTSKVSSTRDLRVF